MKKKTLLLMMMFLVSLSVLRAQEKTANYTQSLELLDQIDKLYLVDDGSFLYKENYPDDDSYKASYLADGSNMEQTNVYSYLWPFSGSISAYVALLESSNSNTIKSKIDDQLLKGLSHYYDQREPHAYASYINSAKESDRFYDDNIWLGIDFLDLYLITNQKGYLEKALEIWTFIESGTDDKLGGGIYWVEQDKKSKNTCSNAPGAVYLLKLYQATQNPIYLQQAKDLYAWTKNNLQDPKDGLYWDNISLKGNVSEAKYAYNTGQMIQAAALLYKFTEDSIYLSDAKLSAESAYTYFFEPVDGRSYRVLKRTDNWFIAVMMRGFVELFHVDGNEKYLQAFQANLDYTWKHNRDEHGLFSKEWKEADKLERKWLLDQFAIAEMLARLSSL